MSISYLIFFSFYIKIFSSYAHRDILAISIQTATAQHIMNWVFLNRITTLVTAASCHQLLLQQFHSCFWKSCNCPKWALSLFGHIKYRVDNAPPISWWDKISIKRLWRWKGKSKVKWIGFVQNDLQRIGLTYLIVH